MWFSNTKDYIQRIIYLKIDISNESVILNNKQIAYFQSLVHSPFVQTLCITKTFCLLYTIFMSEYRCINKMPR